MCSIGPLQSGMCAYDGAFEAGDAIDFEFQMSSSRTGKPMVIEVGFTLHCIKAEHLYVTELSIYNCPNADNFTAASA
jgi:hypothetical protein